MMWWNLFLLFYMCDSMMGLTRCYKMAVFYIYICCFSTSIHSWDTATSAFRQETGAIWKFYFLFQFWTFYRHRHLILRRCNTFGPNWMITDRWRYVDFLPSQIYFRFLVFRRFALRKAYQISTRYLNPRLRYYYFRLLKTDVHHI